MSKNNIQSFFKSKLGIKIKRYLLIYNKEAALNIHDFFGDIDKIEHFIDYRSAKL